MHIAVKGVVPPGPPPVVLPFSCAGSCVSGAGTKCYAQQHVAPAGSLLRLVSTTLVSIPGQAEVNMPEGGYMKSETSAILLPVDSIHTVSTNHLESRPTSKAVKYPLGSQVIAPSPCINNALSSPSNKQKMLPCPYRWHYTRGHDEATSKGH